MWRKVVPGRGVTLSTQPSQFLWCVFVRKKWSLCQSHAADHRVLAQALNGEHVQRRSTGSEPFFLFICLDANKFVLLSFVSLMKTIHPRVSTKPLPNDAKSPNPVDVAQKRWVDLAKVFVWRKVGPTRKVTDLTMEKGWTVYCRWVTVLAESTFVSYVNHQVLKGNLIWKAGSPE